MSRCFMEKSFYRNHYAMIKVPKTELGNNTVLAGPYMLEEVSKKDRRVS